MCYRQAISLNTVAAAAVLILLVRPSDLWSVSFQLSFSATAAIVILVKNFTPRHPKKGHLKQVGYYLLGIIIVSLAAQLGTLPITIYYFGQISSYFLLTNLLVLPLATVLVPCGLLTLVLGGSTAGLWMGKITHGLAWTMNHSVGWIESLPGSTVSAHIGIGMVVVYYLIFILFGIFITKNR
jgi:competence protein ComEC